VQFSAVRENSGKYGDRTEQFGNSVLRERRGKYVDQTLQTV
jgi:hypothetical protein